MYQNIALCVIAVVCSIGVIAYLGYSAYVWAMLTLIHPETPVICINALSIILMLVAVIIGYSYANAYVNAAENEILKHASDIAQKHYQEACSRIKNVQVAPSAPLFNPNEAPSASDNQPPAYC